MIDIKISATAGFSTVSDLEKDVFDRLTKSFCHARLSDNIHYFEFQDRLSKPLRI